MKRYLAFMLAAVLVFSIVPTDVAWGFELSEDGNTRPGVVDTTDGFADQHTDEYADENAVGNTDEYADGYADEYVDGTDQGTEVEPDQQSFNDAKPISVNTQVTDSITDTTNGNFYKFTLSKPGHVDFKFSHGFVDDDSKYWGLKLYSDSDLNKEILERTYKGNELNEVTSDGTGLPKGTFYINIVSYNYSPVNYRFTVEYTASEYCERERNNDAATADQIVVNEEYSGNISEWNDEDYYIFDLTDPGYVDFKFDHVFVNDSATYWKLYLYSYDDLDHEILVRSYEGNETKSVTSYGTGLPAGRYFIRIISYRHSMVKYSFTVGHTATEYCEKERNNSTNTANQIALNKEYRGNISEWNDEDYYSFELADPGYVDFNFRHEFVDDSGAYWKLFLYSNENLNKEILIRSYTGNEKNSVRSTGTGLPAGKYYVKVISYRHSFVNYWFKINHSSSDRFEKERNNSVDTANSISTDTEYNGNITEWNDEDYFEFSLARSGNISFTFSHDFVDGSGNYWVMDLYSSDNVNKSIFSQSFKGNEQNEITTGNLLIARGIYYLRIKSYNHDPGLYHFTVNTSGSVSDPIEVTAPADTMAVGDEMKLEVSNVRGRMLTFTSSKPSVATVDDNGNVKAVKAGTTKITVEAAATESVAASTASISIKVVGLGKTGKLTAVNTSKGIKLTYKQVPGATKYLVYRNNKLIKTINSATKLTYSDNSTLTNGKKYTYKIVAATANTRSDQSRSVAIYRLKRGKISSIKAVKGGKMSLSYSKNTKASGYQIQYSKYPDFSSKKTIRVSKPGTTKIRIKNIATGWYYYVRERCYKKAGGKTYYSAWSTVKKIGVAE